MIPLQIPRSHLQIIFAGLGELPQKVSGPTVAFLQNQLQSLAAAAKKIADEQVKKDADAKAVKPTGKKKEVKNGA
jgi:hypothetical protein